MDIDDAKKIKVFGEKNGVYQSILSISEQVEQSFLEIYSLNLPKKFFLAKNIVIAGMGGSALGGRVVDSVIPQRVRLPIEVFTEFYIPNYVNKETLVIISSYSGSTAETVNDAYEAIKRKALVFIITTGGKLAQIAEKEGIPTFIFEPKFNPSGQPRYALGYSIGAILALLSKCEYVGFSRKEQEELISFIKEKTSDFVAEVDSSLNLAKKFALDLMGKVPVLVTSEHLIGSAHSFKNILNETAKTFAVSFDIPELTHHLMEGLKNPVRIRDFFKFIFFESTLFSKEVCKRYPLTKDVVYKNGFPILTYCALGRSRLQQAFEVIVFSYFVSYYLSFLYQEDPSKIPWVDYFKEKLGGT